MVKTRVNLPKQPGNGLLARHNFVVFRQNHVYESPPMAGMFTILNVRKTERTQYETLRTVREETCALRNQAIQDGSGM